MKIREIDIKNFRGYGENTEEDGFFKFRNLDKADVILLTGHNGYGKSSLYEAIEWCLTNDIKVIRKNTEDSNQKTTLKKSHYLKFQSMHDNREREVTVRIIFDNGSSLVRKTNCNSLHEDGYKSIVYDEHGNVIGENELKEFIEEKMGQPVERFVRLSFCGQSNTEDIVRDTHAKGRGEILLSFLGMDVINEIISNSDNKKNGSLGQKQREVEIEIETGKKAIEQIDTLFKTNSWGSIDDYYKNVNEKLETLVDYCKKIEKENILDKIELDMDSLSELGTTLKQINIIRERVEKKQQRDKQEKNRYIQNRLYSEYKKNKNFLQNAEVMKEVNIVSLQADIAKLCKDRDAYEKIVELLEQQRQELGNNFFTLEEEEVCYLSQVWVNKFEKVKAMYGTVYAKCLEYGIRLEKVSIPINPHRMIYYSDAYRKAIETQDMLLSEKKQTLNMLEGMQDTKRHMLQTVQAFVNESEHIENCPVCGSYDFYGKEEDAKYKLLEIIGEAIANGNEIVKSCNNEIVLIERRKQRISKSYKEKVFLKFFNGIRMLEEASNECINNILEYLGGMIACNNKMLSNISKRIDVLEAKEVLYNDFKKKYQIGNEELNVHIDGIKKYNQWIKATLADKFFIQVDEELYLEENVQEKFRTIVRRIYVQEQIKKMLDDVLQYDIGQENLQLLKKYEDASRKANGLEQQIILYKAAADFRKHVNDEAKCIQNKMIEEYIKKNELIQFIYRFINPHPFFRDFIIEKNGSETNIKSTERNDIHINHLFSEGQMKVLSLSIFLGLNLSINSNQFEQIYIDDPIQSMDDINMVSFIDLLRALNNSEHVNKNIVIGTHDMNFSKLLKIKFRHRTCIEYSFDSYSKEGPKIRETYIGLDRSKLDGVDLVNC